MTSGWCLLSILVCNIEGTIGLVLNLLFICIVATKKTGATDPSYRFCISVNAAQGAINSLLLLSGLWTHILSDSFFVAIVYGPVKYAPKMIRDIITSLAVFAVFCLWQFVTAPCIVQYLVLFGKEMSAIRRICIAYMFTIFSITLTGPYFWLFVPHPEIVGTIRLIATRVQRLGEDDVFEVYGIGLQENAGNGHHTAYDLAFYAIAPSYILTYAIFGFTVMRIVKKLRRVNSEMSIRTIALQRGFIRMHVIQGFIPLGILAIPFITFISFIVTGADLDNWTLMLTFSLWSIPSVQATAYLIYIYRACRAGLSSFIKSCKNRELIERGTRMLEIAQWFEYLVTYQ